MTDWPFGNLEHGKYAVVLADPPWQYVTWSAKGTGRSAEQHYRTMDEDALYKMPVADLAAKDCVLFLWVTWPTLPQALRTIAAWEFEYKTCAFDWTKAHADQIEMFRDDLDGQVGLGHWTRSNTEPCLLATRGKPKRISAAIRQPIIEPRRGHSRKPDCVYDRIERLVAGPYLELFARTKREGWDSWGNEVDKFKPIVSGRETRLCPEAGPSTLPLISSSTTEDTP
jgi:N6-adenosine-specific RNA methylase IME4